MTRLVDPVRGTRVAVEGNFAATLRVAGWRDADAEPVVTKTQESEKTVADEATALIVLEKAEEKAGDIDLLDELKPADEAKAEPAKRSRAKKPKS